MKTRQSSLWFWFHNPLIVAAVWQKFSYLSEACSCTKAETQEWVSFCLKDLEPNPVAAQWSNGMDDRRSLKIKPTFHCKYLLPAQDVWHEVTSDINKQSLDSVDQPIMRRVTSWGRFVSLFTEGGQQFVFCRELSLAGWYFIQKKRRRGATREQTDYLNYQEIVYLCTYYRHAKKIGQKIIICNEI